MLLFKRSTHTYVQGYHAYTDKSEYKVGEVLLLRKESENKVDVNTVAIMKDREVVEHVPFNLNQSFFKEM